MDKLWITFRKEENQKKRVYKKKMSCPYPIKIKNPYYKGTSLLNKDFERKEYFSVGCGRCLQCQIQKNQWLAHIGNYEHNKRGQAVFSTLTYDDEHVPMNEEKTRLTLYYPDFQKFMKRLRQKIYEKTGLRNTISYIACGQYGEEGERPHYHVIIFGLSVNYDKLIQECWGLGDTKNLPLKNGGIEYVIRYQNRDVNRNKEKYNLDKITAPFVTHSIGLGKEFIEQQIDFIIKNNGCYLGKKNHLLPIPAYYMRKYRLHRPIDYTQIQEEMKGKHLKPKNGIQFTKSECEEYKWKMSQIKEELAIRQSRAKGSPQEDFNEGLHESVKNEWNII